MELDPALQGEIELDPALSGVIETDPALAVDVVLDPELHPAAEAGTPPGDDPHETIPEGAEPPQPQPPTAALEADDPPAEEPVEIEPISKKSTPSPTLRPLHALVVPGTDGGETSNRPSPDAGASPEAVASTAAPEAVQPIDEPMAEEPMSENRESPDGAPPGEEEASMTESTTQARPAVDDAPVVGAAGEAGDEPLEAAPVAQAHEPTEAADEPVVDAAPVEAANEPAEAANEPVEAANEPAEAANEPVEAANEPVEAANEPVEAANEPVEAANEPVEAANEPVEATHEPVEAANEPVEATHEPGVRGADDLFEAVPRHARHFMALLAQEGTLLMPQVMDHLGLVRPKGVGGAIEPIQRIARLIAVEMPFDADFAESGFKRWTWRAAPLSEVPAEALEPIPPPPPQKKKPKARPKADRSRYKKAWKRSLEAKKRKGRGRGRRNEKRPVDGQVAAPTAVETPTVAEPTAPPTKVPAAHRDESGNADRAGRRGAPTPEARRRRYDRPMPEVFRRTNRPAASRPAPPRRDESLPRAEPVAAGERKHDEQPRPSATRPTVPRLDRSASDPNAASQTPVRRGVTTPEERLPLPRSGAFRRRTVGDSDVPVVVIRRRKR